jgi:hypothetical protein
MDEMDRLLAVLERIAEGIESLVGDREGDKGIFCDLCFEPIESPVCDSCLCS